MTEWDYERLRFVWSTPAALVSADDERYFFAFLSATKDMDRIDRELLVFGLRVG